MAIDIKFDLVGHPEPPTILLANRNGNILGQLDVDVDSIDLLDRLNDASELTFTMHKVELDLSENEMILYNEFLKSSNNYTLKDSNGLYLISKDSDGGFIVSKEVFKAYLWEKIVDFKLVYCKEWDAWFEIKVELDEATETIKTVFCTQLGQAELSQIMLYNVEINTEADIDRDDYKISILYDLDDPEASILNRLLKDKAPHYSIEYVSPTIAKIQRSFSFDGTSILDAFQEISEEIGCLFQYYAGIKDGRLQRKIAVYDLQQNCNDCGYRGEFTDKCPKCGSTNVKNGYGKDTLIFVTSDELASEGIELATDTDAVKNCFRLEAGDDLMTSTVRNCNPNGTNYIWYFSDSLKEDMTDELIEKLDAYDEMYKQYYGEYVSDLDSELLSSYNALVEKYVVYNEDLQTVSTPITGYSSLMNADYNAIDLALYLESGLMPSIEMSDTTAEEQADLLIASSLSPVATSNKNVDDISLSTAKIAVESMAKIIVRSTYKVEVNESAISEKYSDDDGEYKFWTGNFIVTNYSDEEDTAISGTVKVRVNIDEETFIQQKIDKTLNKEDTDDYSVSGLFKRDYDDFCSELKKYALRPLEYFYQSCEDCLVILQEQGAGNKDENPDLYESLYEPYLNKLSAIASEIKVREGELAVVESMQRCIEECKAQIQNALNFEDYLGEELWLEFCAYRREDTYSNDNYISDGLNNAELFQKAQEFLEVAENEIYKSAELQRSISTTLNNLLAIPKFKPLIDSFDVGNWIRIQVDDKIYKLRLLEYGINFGDFNTFSVEFSDVSKIKNGVTDVKDILSQASSMATSYSSVRRQANQGDRAKSTIEQWIEDGLNSANVQIQSNDSEDITLTKNGILCRSYDDITNTYSPEQLRITHNIMAYTNDEWKTVRQAIGKHDYKYFDSDADELVDKTGYGVSADFVNAGVVSGSQIIGGDVYSDNYSQTKGTGSYLNLRTGDFSFGGGALRFDSDNKKLYIGSDMADTNITEINEEWLKTTKVYAEFLQVNEANIQGDITANGLIVNNANGNTLLYAKDNAVSIAGWNVDSNSLYSTYADTSSRVFMSTGTSFKYTIGGHEDNWYFGAGTSTGNGFGVTTSGVLYASGANISGDITATSGTIGGCEIVDDLLTVDAARITTGVFDKARIPTLSADKINVSEVITVGRIATTDDIPSVPTKVSELENDKSYLTDDTLATTNVIAKNLQVQNVLIEDDDGNILFDTRNNSVEIGGWTIAKDGINSENYDEGSNAIIVWEPSTSVTYPDGLGFTLLDNGTYEVMAETKSALPTELTIPSFYNNVAVTSIANSAFKSCTNLTSVVIPNSINSIGNSAFSGCTSLTSVELPNSITSINRAAFYKCSKLTNITIPDSVVTIAELAFEGSGLSSVTIPDSVVVIGELAFDNIMATSAVIGRSVKSIGAGAFGGNTLLNYVYYKGTQDEWNDITIDASDVSGISGSDVNNTRFTDTARRYYYSETNPNELGNFWCYKNTNGVSISCDDTLIDSQYFKVLSDGQIIAERAIIKGDVTANSLKATDSFTVVSGADYDNAKHYITTAFTKDGGFATTCRQVGKTDTYGGYMKADNTGLIIKCEKGAGLLDGTWNASASIGTNSDQSLKHDIEALDDRYSVLFDSLQPVRYKYNDGSSDRYHTGFIAQSVEESIEDAGLSTQDFAAFVKTENNCALRYEEFIALCVDEIQKLKKRIAELEAKLEM